MARPRKGAEGTWKPLFLASLAENANVRQACIFAGISRSAAYAAHKRAEDNDEDNFNELWDDAIEQGLDYLEEILIKLGTGELKGQAAGPIFLLKARRYEKRQGSDMPSKLTLEWGGNGEV